MERCPRTIRRIHSREVNGVCTSGPNMTEHTFEEGRTKTNIRVEGRARTLYLGGRKPAEDSGTHLGSREEGDKRVIKLEGTPGLDTNATWMEVGGRRRYPSKIRSRRTR